MLQITKEQALKKLDELPESLKEALLSNEIEAVILQSCQKHNLNEKQVEIIGIAVGDVFFGFLLPSHLTQELIKDGFSADLANSLYKDMDEKIFASLKKELDQVYSKQDLRIFQPLKPAFPDSESASGQQTAEKQQTGRPPEKNEQKLPEPPAPKIIHYSDLRTPLDEPLQKNAQTAITQEQLPSADEPKIRLDTSDTQSSAQAPTPPPNIPNKISPKNIIDLKDIPL